MIPALEHPTIVLAAAASRRDATAGAIAGDANTTARSMLSSCARTAVITSCTASPLSLLSEIAEAHRIRWAYHVVAHDTRDICATTHTKALSRPISRRRVKRVHPRLWMRFATRDRLRAADWFLH